MWVFLIRRVLLGVLTLFGALVIVFLLTHLLPGNPALVQLGNYGNPKALKALEQEMGLNRPLWTQFASYLQGLGQLNLGTSYNTGEPVVQGLEQRLPATAELAFWSTLLATCVGVPLGIWTGLRPGTIRDAMVRGVAVLGTSIPLYWLGLIIVFVFYAVLKLAPAPSGRLGAFVSPPPHITGLYTFDAVLSGDFGVLGDVIGHLWMPVVTLAAVEIAPVLKIARSATAEVMTTDFVRTARALGLGQWQIVGQDVLRNVGVQLLTIVGIVLGYLLGGSVLVERIFDWPGIGQYAWNAMLSNDLEAIQGFILLVAFIYVCINLAIDILYMVVDPRIRYA